MSEQELREAQAEVLLCLARAANCLNRTLPDCDAKTYLEKWIPATAAWAGVLVAEHPPLLSVVG